MPSSILAKSKTVTAFALEDLVEAVWLPPEATLVVPRILGKSAVWTGRLNGRIVAICGITAIHPHYAKAWTYLHPDALAHRFWLHRAVARVLRHYVAASEFWRVEADCYTTHTAAARWLKTLKFHAESHLPLYGPKGECMTRFVWFPRGLCG